MPHVGALSQDRIGLTSCFSFHTLHGHSRSKDDEANQQTNLTDEAFSTFYFLDKPASSIASLALISL
jgi:hypothetical protein